MSTIISVIAVAISLISFHLGQRRYRRETFLKLHEALVAPDLQEGRRIIQDLYNKSGNAADLSKEDYASANRALAFFDVAGIYCYKKHIDKKEFIELWAASLVRLKYAAQTFLAHRDAFWSGLPTWPYFRRLANDAEEYLRAQGVDVSKFTSPKPPDAPSRS